MIGKRVRVVLQGSKFYGIFGTVVKMVTNNDVAVRFADGTEVVYGFGWGVVAA